MATKTTKTSAKSKLGGVQSQAKAAYAKGTAALDEIKSFTKGNVDAVVASGKILGAGLKVLGEGYVAEGRNAVSTFNADMKELTAVKSPLDFFKLQSKILGRNVGTVVDFQTRNAEAVMKLAKDSVAPISQRVEVAIEAVRKAA